MTLAVSVADAKSHLPVSDLTKSDFKILDNGRAVSVSTFDSGSQYSTRPVVLWLVALCNEQHQGLHGSDPLFGQEEQFEAAATHLDAADTVGVAEWCDDGDTRFLLPPSAKGVSLVPALQQAAMPIPFFEVPPASRVGEFALQHLMRMILTDAHARIPEPQPVVVFLNEDYTGLPEADFENLEDDMLSSSAVVFGIRNSDVPTMDRLTNGEHGEILASFSEDTGGTYFSVPSRKYEAALEDIILRLHFRYELGFIPAALDEKKHRITVALTDEARARHPHAQVQARSSYMALRDEPGWYSRPGLAQPR